jgi:hypothetical protein
VVVPVKKEKRNLIYRDIGVEVEQFEDLEEPEREKERKKAKISLTQCGHVPHRLRRMTNQGPGPTSAVELDSTMKKSPSFPFPV